MTNARFIRIETPNGVTVNSRFVPTTGVLNNTSGVPGRGAEGVLVGTLSGRAFTPTGSPIFFNNVSTRLGFSLTNFDPLFEAEGTLIRSQQQGAAPLVFVPASVSLSNGSSQNFNANDGRSAGGQLHRQSLQWFD
ncbi:MAG: hypothetical protein HC925_05000 [Coleofasciculaceae cyanobacterium SM2_3_26]|nr:hypothetical protein [Coleofasciculaceae cyanobacterium SM2_3_26]